MTQNNLIITLLFITIDGSQAVLGLITEESS
mgnify:CR=1 FL=1